MATAAFGEYISTVVDDWWPVEFFFSALSPSILCKGPRMEVPTVVPRTTLDTGTDCEYRRTFEVFDIGAERCSWEEFMGAAFT